VDNRPGAIHRVSIADTCTELANSKHGGFPLGKGAETGCHEFGRLG
jgi:hypothetical protein